MGGAAEALCRLLAKYRESPRPLVSRLTKTRFAQTGAALRQRAPYYWESSHLTQRGPWLSAEVARPPYFEEASFARPWRPLRHPTSWQPRQFRALRPPPDCFYREAELYPGCLSYRLLQEVRGAPRGIPCDLWLRQRSFSAEAAAPTRGSSSAAHGYRLSKHFYKTTSQSPRCGQENKSRHAAKCLPTQQQQQQQKQQEQQQQQQDQHQRQCQEQASKQSTEHESSTLQQQHSNHHHSSRTGETLLDGGALPASSSTKTSGDACCCGCCCCSNSKCCRLRSSTTSGECNGCTTTSPAAAAAVAAAAAAVTATATAAAVSSEESTPLQRVSTSPSWDAGSVVPPDSTRSRLTEERPEAAAALSEGPPLLPSASSSFKEEASLPGSSRRPDSAPPMEGGSGALLLLSQESSSGIASLPLKALPSEASDEPLRVDSCLFPRSRCSSTNNPIDLLVPLGRGASEAQTQGAPAPPLASQQCGTHEKSVISVNERTLPTAPHAIHPGALQAALKGPPLGASVVAVRAGEAICKGAPLGTLEAPERLKEPSQQNGLPRISRASRSSQSPDRAGPLGNPVGGPSLGAFRERNVEKGAHQGGQEHSQPKASVARGPPLEGSPLLAAAASSALCLCPPQQRCDSPFRASDASSNPSTGRPNTQGPPPEQPEGLSPYRNLAILASGQVEPLKRYRWGAFPEGSGGGSNEASVRHALQWTLLQGRRQRSRVFAYFEGEWRSLKRFVLALKEVTSSSTSDKRRETVAEKDTGATREAEADAGTQKQQQAGKAAGRAFSLGAIYGLYEGDYVLASAAAVVVIPATVTLAGVELFLHEGLLTNERLSFEWLAVASSQICRRHPSPPMLHPLLVSSYLKYNAETISFSALPAAARAADAAAEAAAANAAAAEAAGFDAVILKQWSHDTPALRDNHGLGPQPEALLGLPQPPASAAAGAAAAAAAAASMKADTPASSSQAAGAD
ncbi:hypothetical protein Emag_000283 [Eimeria magna]